jgi:hypothetical protein
MRRSRPDIVASLQSAFVRLRETPQSDFAQLFLPEHLERLADRLTLFLHQGVPAVPPPPYFDAEITPSLGPIFAPFAGALAHPDDAGVAEALTPALETVGCGGLLLLLGQRRTPASLTDTRAIPPTTAELLQASVRPCSSTDPLTVAARALSKHNHRDLAGWWGEVTGSVSQKNAAARQVIERLLGSFSWWNCFGHPKHEVVHEVRVASGHGARWALPGLTFVGFLEPFLSGDGD